MKFERLQPPLRYIKISQILKSILKKRCAYYQFHTKSNIFPLVLFINYSFQLPLCIPTSPFLPPAPDIFGPSDTMVFTLSVGKGKKKKTLF